MAHGRAAARDTVYGRRGGGWVEERRTSKAHVRRARYEGGPLAGIEAPLPARVPVLAAGGFYRLVGESYRWEQQTTPEEASRS